jgi:hypothetical protein
MSTLAGLRHSRQRGDMKPMTMAVISALLVAGCAGPEAPVAARAPAATPVPAATAAALVPVDHAMCFVEPGQSATLRWRGGQAGPLAFTLRGFAGEESGAGSTAPDADGTQAITRSFARGYHEIAFPVSGQTFGVVALEARRGPADPFFAIDAALSWLDTDPARRDALVRVLARSGIALARERMGLGAVHPAPATWTWDKAPRDFAAVRATYLRQGMPLLEMLHGGAGHLGMVKGFPYPQDLAPLAQAWTAVARHWGAGWGAAEADNEPDLGGVPAEQYVAVVKTMSRALAEAGGAAPLVTGVFAHLPPGPYFDACTANGLFADSDAISFHSYDRAPAVEAAVARYRAWMEAGGAAAMPLWHSECGWPWVNGPGRPPLDQDRLSAIEIAAKAVESRACGVARYFPFVLVYYEEGHKNFGMMGREATPLRSMAAYVQCVDALAGRRYCGDLQGLDGVVALARVFAGDEGQPWVAVLYTGAPAPDAAVRLPLPALRAAGADGRALALTDGRVPLADGLAYVWLDPAAAAAHLRRDTPAARLLARGEQPWSRARLAAPLVLQLQAQHLPARASARRYLLSEEAARALPIRARVHNLADRPATVSAEFTLPGATPLPAAPVLVPARGCAELAWTVDASAALDIAATRLAVVSARSAEGVQPTPLAIPLMMEGPLERHLARHPHQRALPIAELARWSANHAGHGSSRFALDGGTWRVENRFTGTANNWDYPKFTLGERIDPRRESGFLIRARIAKAAGNVAIMANPNQPDSFWCSDLFPADGAWHVVYVPFAELKPGPNGAGMQNTRLDPAAWRVLALGMSSRSTENSLEVSHLLVVGGAE